jgi:uncharacterized protein (TIGR02001 family)
VKLKKIAAALFISTSIVSLPLMAQTTTAEPESGVTYNAGVVSDYRYRGISQSGHKPALQFGADYIDKSGFYAGNWNSTIEWIKDRADKTAAQSARGPLEMDLYAGYKGSISERIAYDAGVLQYYFPTSDLNSVTNASVNGVRANYSTASTTELYGALSVGAFTFKLYDSVTNLFGYVGTKNSAYVDLSYSFDFGDGFSSIVHYGNQTMKATNAAAVTKGVTDYNDYSMSLNKDFNGIVVSTTVIATDWVKRGYLRTNDVLPGTGNTNLAGNTVVLGVKKNF